VQFPARGIVGCREEIEAESQGKTIAEQHRGYIDQQLIGKAGSEKLPCEFRSRLEVQLIDFPQGQLMQKVFEI
jgi:beta-galactosidase beta subunit